MEYADYRHTEEAYLTMIAHSNMETNNDPIQYPEDTMFTVDNVETRTSQSGTEYKKATLTANGFWWDVTIFPDNAQYKTAEKGSKLDGWIRQTVKGYTLVGYSKPSRTCEDGEYFISPNGTKIGK